MCVRFHLHNCISSSVCRGLKTGKFFTCLQNQYVDESANALFVVDSLFCVGVFMYVCYWSTAVTGTTYRLSTIRFFSFIHKIVHSGDSRAFIHKFVGVIVTRLVFPVSTRTCYVYICVGGIYWKNNSTRLVDSFLIPPSY